MTLGVTVLKVMNSNGVKDQQRAAAKLQLVLVNV